MPDTDHRKSRRFRLHLWQYTACAVLLIALMAILNQTLIYDDLRYGIGETDVTRHAATSPSDLIPADPFGDTFREVRYVNQNWSPSDSMWFYTTTQGSDLLPYDFFIAVEQEKSQTPFHNPANMNSYRYLPQKPSGTNPDGLPVGMVADKYDGQKYLGLTCAACHTSQVNYNGTGIRIDGGPGGADMDRFMHDLAGALTATATDRGKRTRFVAAVMKSGAYRSEDAVLADLKTYTLRLQAYDFFNESSLDGKPVPYGFARLDAFGRIYNRVLEHVVNADAMRAALLGLMSRAEADKLLQDLEPVLSSENRDALMEKLQAALPAEKLPVLRDRIFNHPNAPVSYPFIWDIPQHDYVQWNGIGANAGAGPLGRNTGEVIGVFATLNWVQKPNSWIRRKLTGKETHIDYKSSANIHNLRNLEDRLVSLWSPRWEDAGLPAIIKESRDRGETLFDKRCAGCHPAIDRTSADRRVVANMNSVHGADGTGTDPRMADNSIDYQGYSGILRNEYLKTGVGSVLLDKRAPVAALLTSSTESVIAAWTFGGGIDRFLMVLKSTFRNEIKPSVKSGRYTPDTTQAPFQSLRSYKARPLDGIWATAPYLHNGSVPTIYDLLLPPDERPKKFVVGSRELDVKKVGFRSEGYGGFEFDTTQPANSNAGHDYKAAELSEQDRWDLVEYIKTL